MALFSKGGLPVQKVKQLRGEGLGNEQIISELRAQGFSLQQINDAMSQAEMANPEIQQNYEWEHGQEVPKQGAGAPPQTPPPGVAPGEMAGTMPAGETRGVEMDERMEDIAEGIIEEKWQDFVAEMKKVLEWKDKVEEQIKKIEGDVENLKTDFKELHRGVLGKIEEYDEGMRDVSTELKAVGKVFKEVIPAFAEDVKELGSITKSLKKK